MEICCSHAAQVILELNLIANDRDLLTGILIGLRNFEFVLLMQFTYLHCAFVILLPVGRRVAHVRLGPKQVLDELILVRCYPDESVDVCLEFTKIIVLKHPLELIHVKLVELVIQYKFYFSGIRHHQVDLETYIICVAIPINIGRSWSSFSQAKTF